ncbi:molecular chaperone DnaJ [Aurantiacibacter poecillastricola]|uniref:molecular chaperone DnaJ n=1 Tax=Aurantiacibacter poecillastricola TaxID=3064385 RepID=UPI00273F893E|nr:molecular chaperone DnaJ [Aurantiacibacter sp. 219JJ12-13]MDP5260365.1 molecular chaperone DnaJ [Aurantiacibacter sp. 219JJ12-13]
MGKFIVFIGLAILVYYWIFKRWPWQPKLSSREAALTKARETLGVSRFANRGDIIAAHKRLVTTVHPDRGGSSEKVHEANAARDLLLEQLPDNTT